MKKNVLLAALAVAGIAGQARAAQVTWDFAGTSNSFFLHVTGSFTFDTNAVDTDSDPQIGNYALSSMSVTFADQNPAYGTDRANAWETYTVANPFMQVANNATNANPNFDLFTVYGTTQLVSADETPFYPDTSVQFTLFDQTNNLLTTDALVTTPPALSQVSFQRAVTHYLTLNNFTSSRGQFNLTSLTLRADEQAPDVPEPATLGIVGLGIAGIALLRRNSRSA